MAKVVKIIKNQKLKTINKKISEVEMAISFSDDNKYIIMETFGSINRQDKGKASQIIHLDKDMVNKLIEILKEWK